MLRRPNQLAHGSAKDLQASSNSNQRRNLTELTSSLQIPPKLADHQKPQATQQLQNSSGQLYELSVAAHQPARSDAGQETLLLISNILIVSTIVLVIIFNCVKRHKRKQHSPNEEQEREETNVSSSDLAKENARPNSGGQTFSQRSESRGVPSVTEIAEGLCNSTIGEDVVIDLHHYDTPSGSARVIKNGQPNESKADEEQHKFPRLISRVEPSLEFVTSEQTQIDSQKKDSEDAQSSKSVSSLTSTGTQILSSPDKLVEGKEADGDAEDHESKGRSEEPVKSNQPEFTQEIAGGQKGENNIVDDRNEQPKGESEKDTSVDDHKSSKIGASEPETIAMMGKNSDDGEAKRATNESSDNCRMLDLTNKDFEGLGDEDKYGKKLFIYLVHSDDHLVAQKECVARIDLAPNQRLTLSDLRQLITQSPDISSACLKRSKFKFVTETYRLLNGDEDKIILHQVYPTLGIFLKLDTLERSTNRARPNLGRTRPSLQLASGQPMLQNASARYNKRASVATARIPVRTVTTNNSLPEIELDSAKRQVSARASSEDEKAFKAVPSYGRSRSSVQLARQVAAAEERQHLYRGKRKSSASNVKLPSIIR